MYYLFILLYEYNETIAKHSNNSIKRSNSYKYIHALQCIKRMNNVIYDTYQTLS